MTAQEVDDLRAELRQLVARFLRADDFFLRIAPGGTPLPGMLATYQKAGEQVDKLVEDMESSILKIKSELGELYDLSMDWPSTEEIGVKK